MKISIGRIAAVIVASLGLFSGDARATCNPSTFSVDYVIIFNFFDQTAQTKIVGFEPTAKAALFGKLASSKPAVPPPGETAVTVADIADASAKECRAAALEDLKTISTDPSTLRYKKGRGKSFAIYVFAPDATTVDVKFTETTRETELVTDLHSLGDIVKSILALAGPGSKPGPGLYLQLGTLQYDRATLSITATMSHDKDSTTLSTNVITGSAEHWSLSANVPLKKASEVMYNSDTKQLEVKETPTKFLVSLDFVLGDLLDPNLNRPVVKALFEASSTPANTVGAGIGYKFRNWNGGFLGLELDAFSPFVGWVYSQDDSVTNGSVAKGHKWLFTWGLTFDLRTAAGWLKNKTSSNSSGDTKKSQQ